MTFMPREPVPVIILKLYDQAIADYNMALSLDWMPFSAKHSCYKTNDLIMAVAFVTLKRKISQTRLVTLLWQLN